MQGKNVLKGKEEEWHYLVGGGFCLTGEEKLASKKKAFVAHSVARAVYGGAVKSWNATTPFDFNG